MCVCVCVCVFPLQVSWHHFKWGFCLLIFTVCCYKFPNLLIDHRLYKYNRSAFLYFQINVFHKNTDLFLCDSEIRGQMVIIYAKLKISMRPFINKNSVTSQFASSLRKLWAEICALLCFLFLPSIFWNRLFISVSLHYLVLLTFKKIMALCVVESGIKFSLVDGEL